MVETEPVPDVTRRRLELRVLVAFAYCALVLTLLEYKFLSARVLASGWLSGSAPADRQLHASLIWAGATITFFLVLPALIVLLWHREPLASVGFSLTRRRPAPPDLPRPLRADVPDPAAGRRSAPISSRRTRS